MLKRFIIFIFLFGVMVYISPSDVDAVAPTISGRVINKQTGAPISGVWVRLQTGGCRPQWDDACPECTRRTEQRFEQTNSNGEFYFEHIDAADCGNPKIGRSIDTNADGSNDSVQMPVAQDNCYFENGAKICTGLFGCSTAPYSFSIVKPAGWNGSFESVNNIYFNNGDADFDIGALEYNPGGSSSSGPSSTPQPSATATTGCSTNGTCSRKQIGSISSTAVGQAFNEQSSINISDQSWVRLTINGHTNTGSNTTNIYVEERINTSYFSLATPRYGGSDATFVITKPNDSGPGEEDVTPAICGGSTLSCITQANASQIYVTLDGIEAGEVRYIYIKASPTNVASSSIPVNTTGNLSKIQYSFSNGTNRDYTLDNTNVRIVGSLSHYFQTSKGNTYSDSTSNESIKPNLPANTLFATDRSSIVLHQGSASFAPGRVSETGWQVGGYKVKNEGLNYSALLSKYGTSIDRTINISGINQFGLTGYYVDKQSDESSGHYILSGGGWKNQTLNNKKVVLFVRGNLYIDESFAIAKNGNSSLIFVVGGNMGIDPRITKLEGSFIVDGAVDTACSSSSGFSGTSCSSGQLPLDIPLTIEGMVVAGGGFKLERQPQSVPGETFIGRPDFMLSAITTLGRNVYSWKEYAN